MLHRNVERRADDAFFDVHNLDLLVGGHEFSRVCISRPSVIEALVANRHLKASPARCRKSRYGLGTINPSVDKRSPVRICCLPGSSVLRIPKSWRPCAYSTLICSPFGANVRSSGNLGSTEFDRSFLPATSKRKSRRGPSSVRTRPTTASVEASGLRKMWTSGTLERFQAVLH